MTLDVQFLQSKHPGRTLAPFRGAGTVSRAGDVLVLTGTRPRKVLHFLLGAAGFVVGLLAAAIGAVVLAELGFDLMAYRRGGGLVAMVALAAGMALGTGLIRIAEWLVGPASHKVAVPTSALSGIGADDGMVAAVWTQGSRTHWVVMGAPDGETSPLMDLLRGNQQADT